MTEKTLTRMREVCRCCNSSRLTLSVNLRPVPIVSPNMNVSNTALNAELAPLDIYICEDCGFNQLLHVVDPSLIYTNYLYQTKISLGLDEHFKSLQELIVNRLSVVPGNLVVEFGSNDGTLLSCFKSFGARVQGIDPAELASQSARDKGIPTITDFFSANVAEAIKQEVGRASVILSNNTMANIDDLLEIWKAVETLLTEDGVFVFETQYALDVYEKNLLDVIYHEHISYFSVMPLVQVLTQHGLELFDVDLLQTKGGSIRFWVQKVGGKRPISDQVSSLLKREEAAGLYSGDLPSKFAKALENIQERIEEIFRRAEVSGGKIAAYGTSVGCAALIHQFDLQGRLLGLFDDNPTKEIIEGPGYSLPVYGPQNLASCNPECVLVLAWRYAANIVEKHTEYLKCGGEFFVVLPEGSFYGGE